MEFKFIILIYSSFVVNVIESEDNYGIMNSKRAINTVDEKFVSISVDPAILLSGVKISTTTKELAAVLAPAYLRFAGPSTGYLDFDPDETHATTRITESTDRMILTPGALASVNRWITAANLTPVFGLNDWNRIPSGEATTKWDTKHVMGLLEEMAKKDGDCYWQLGFDNSNKTLHEYKEDIKTLKNIIDTFPKQSEHWQILGSDFTNCIGNDDFSIGSMKNKFEGVDSIIWERNNEDVEGHLEEQTIKSLMHETSIWTVAPKTKNPITFESAILWGNQIGKAATEGFKVIFRQPRIHEFFTDTPPFWVSYLHKNLMGRNVLDIRMLDNNLGNVSVFGHCAKMQNNFPKAGAISIFIINNSTEMESVNLKITGVFPNNKKTYEVQSFILEASNEDQSSIVLNGNKLSLRDIEHDKHFIPKLRRARLNKNMSFNMPSKSIGFFLLPGARLPVCIYNEDEEDLILQEIIADQKIKFDEEHDDMYIKPRIVERKANLNDLYQMVEKELETDEKYYKKHAGLDAKTTFADKINELKNKKSTQDDIKLVLDIPQILEVKSVDQRVQELKHKIKEKLEAKKIKNNLDLSNNEMAKVLKERAVSKIEKSKALTESDLEDFIHKAINLKSRQKRNANHGNKRIPSRAFSRANKGGKVNQMNHSPGQINNNPHNRNRNILRRPRRDINIDFLRSKTNGANCNDEKDNILAKLSKSQFENNDEVEATLRQPGQTSLELLTDSLEDEEDEEEKIPSEVFAELAEPAQEDKSDELSKFFGKKEVIKKPSFTWDDSMLKPKPKVDFSSLFHLSKLKPALIEIKPRKANIDDEEQKYIDEIDSFESLEEDGLNNYHGFFENLGDARPKNIDKQKEYFEYATEIEVESKNLKEKLNKLNELLSNKKPKSEDDFEVDDSFRRKRDVREYTEDDVVFYKKLMQGNIKHMRDQMAKNRIRTGMENLNSGFPKFFKTRSGKINKGVKSKNSDNTKEKLEDMKIENQKKILKARLTNRKKLEEKRTQSKSVDTVLSKLKAKSKDNNVNTNLLRKKRSSNEKFNEIYKSNIQLKNILQAYEPILQLTMQDFLPQIQKPRKYAIEIVDLNLDTPELEVPTLQKSKRYATREDEFDMLQDITHIFNGIEKDSKFLQPFFDEESGEYDIIFPTKDEIKLVRNRGMAEIEFLHKSAVVKTTTENPVDKQTCTANYQEKKDIVNNSSDSSVEFQNLDLIDVDIKSNLVEYDEMPSTEYINVFIGEEKNEYINLPTTKDVLKASTETLINVIEATETNNIQHIPTQDGKDNSKLDMIEKVIGQFKNFLDTIGSTVKKYVHIFHEGSELVNATKVIKNDKINVQQ